MALKRNLIKSLSEEMGEIEKPLVLLAFLNFSNYSHSMVPMGLGVRSIRTRLMPSTSWVIR